jgi:hypothetical protein
VASIDSTIILYISGLSCIMMNNVSERQNVVVIHHCLQKVIEALNTAYYTHIHHSLKAPRTMGGSHIKPSFESIFGACMVTIAGGLSILMR